MTNEFVYSATGCKESKMKRKLFDELHEGFSALQAAREGKLILREQVIEKKSASTNAHWKTGNKAARARMHKLQF